MVLTGRTILPHEICDANHVSVPLFTANPCNEVEITDLEATYPSVMVTFTAPATRATAKTEDAYSLNCGPNIIASPDAGTLECSVTGEWVNKPTCQREYLFSFNFTRKMFACQNSV